MYVSTKQVVLINQEIHCAGDFTSITTDFGIRIPALRKEAAGRAVQ